VDDGRVLQTTDGGQTWAPVLERSNYRFSGVHLESPQVAWTVAEFIDTVFKTTDGGATWTYHKLPYNTFWQDLAYMDADTGYLAGGSTASGFILRTTDGGNSWALDYDERAAFQKLWVQPGEEYIWAVGFGGNIMHYSPCAVAAEISNLSGAGEPCEGSVVVYEVDSEGATIFTWNIPDGWAIQGSDNSSRIEVLVGSKGGEVTIQAANSCGLMTETLSQNVLPLHTEPVTIIESAGVLSTMVNGAGYLWYKDGSPVPGATGQSFTPEETGAYFLVVMFPNGCNRNSNILNIVITGVYDIHNNKFSAYPNPVSDVLNIQNKSGQEMLGLEVYNSNGVLILRTDVMRESLCRLNTQNLKDGVYFVRVMTATGAGIVRFVKQ
jgi:hypothetical protein